VCCVRESIIDVFFSKRITWEKSLPYCRQFPGFNKLRKSVGDHSEDGVMHVTKNMEIN
jgi:hypothetical protein